jgi:hypothetical protein
VQPYRSQGTGSGEQLALLRSTSIAGALQVLPLLLQMYL